MYWKYLLYILQHKWYVWHECLKSRQFIHGLTHDLSKFLPSEFFPYARYFYGPFPPGPEQTRAFQHACTLHKRRNKHHWDYWLTAEGQPEPMPEKYLRQMLADWRAMSRKFGGSVHDTWLNKKDTMTLHPQTRAMIEALLNESS